VMSYKDRVLPPVTPADLVDANGSCGGTAASGEGVPMIPAAIALPQVGERLTALGSEVAGGTPEQFAELIRKETIKWADVVKRAGIAEKVDIGVNERRERTATLTYIHGQRPGVYGFTAGRLTSLERAPEPVAPPKPAKKPAKPAKRAAQPNQVSVQ